MSSLSDLSFGTYEEITLCPLKSALCLGGGDERSVGGGGGGFLDQEILEPKEKLGSARDVFFDDMFDLRDCLGELINIYDQWVSEKTYCSAEYLDHHTGEVKFKFWEAPKRGNERYVSDVKQRLAESLPSAKDLRGGVC